jgi:ribosome-associated translation inhibitor RaiA
LDLTLVFRDVRAGPRLREQLETSSAALARYFRAIQSIDWEFTRDGDEIVARCRVHSRSGFYRASTHCARAIDGVDAILDKLTKQRRRSKRRDLRQRRISSSTRRP